MYSSNADKKIKVISNLEAMMVFIIFSFILYFLYPKDMLEKQVLAEKSNYDLTALYLENMLRLEPENKKLTLALIKASAQSGQFDLAFKMIKVLNKNADLALQIQLTRYQFEALKTKYFSTNEKDLQLEVRQEMKILFKDIVKQNLYDKKDSEYWYKGAREFSLHISALYFLHLLLNEEEKTKWLEECFYLSSDLKDEKMQGRCLKSLRKHDSKSYEKWTKTAYYLALSEGNEGQAIALLKDMASRSKKWRAVLASYYIELGRYHEASNEYMYLYHTSTYQKDKQSYFLKALESLVSGGLLNEAAALARKYEALYYHNKKMSRHLIKLYLSAGKLDDAKRISIKRFERIK